MILLVPWILEGYFLYLLTLPLVFFSLLALAFWAGVSSLHVAGVLLDTLLVGLNVFSPPSYPFFPLGVLQSSLNHLLSAAPFAVLRTFFKGVRLNLNAITF